MLPNPHMENEGVEPCGGDRSGIFAKILGSLCCLMFFSPHSEFLAILRTPPSPLTFHNVKNHGSGDEEEGVLMGCSWGAHGVLIFFFFSPTDE